MSVLGQERAMLLRINGGKLEICEPNNHFLEYLFDLKECAFEYRH